MVKTTKCEHCGAETQHPVTKRVDGRALDFCCGSCFLVYELEREEGAQDPAKAKERDARNPERDKK
jgi:hypothetical protein